MLRAMANARNADSGWRAGSRRKLWGMVWLVVAAGIFQSGYWEPREALAQQEHWPAVVAEVTRSEVAYDSAAEQYELRVRLKALYRGAILHDDMPKRRGREGDLLRELESDFQLGADVDCLIDPAQPDALFVPPAHDFGPILMGLVPAILLALVGLKLLLTAARRAASD